MWLRYALAASLCAGIFTTSFRFARPLVQGNEIFIFLFWYNLVAVVFLCPLTIFKRPPLREIPVKYGVAMGITVGFESIGVIMGLAYLPGLVFYPIYSMVWISLSVLVPMFVWREKLSSRQWCGVACAALAVIFVGLKPFG